MKKFFDNKQQMREDLERRTDPNSPVLGLIERIVSSGMAAGLIGLRNSLSLLRKYTTDNQDFPCEEHKEFTHRTMQGMSERMTAFELEMINVLVDLAWEVHECECDHCKALEAEMDSADKASKAKYN